ncbi:MAG: hypothetical protein ACI8WY_001950, partial [Planctomycetota bacterium]
MVHSSTSLLRQRSAGSSKRRLARILGALLAVSWAACASTVGTAVLPRTPSYALAPASDSPLGRLFATADAGDCM